MGYSRLDTVTENRSLASFASGDDILVSCHRSEGLIICVLFYVEKFEVLPISSVLYSQNSFFTENSNTTGVEACQS
jgi:hypothetical protein